MRKIILLCVLVLFVCGNSFGWIEDYEILEIGRKVWTLPYRVSLKETASPVSEAILFVYCGQAVKILENRDIWVRVQVLHNEPGWKYDGKKWIEANEKNSASTEGWITKSVLSKTKPAKPEGEPIETKGGSRCFEPNRNK